MNKLTYVKKSVICAVCIALCVVLPMAFHAINNAGSVICPMHIPPLLCGLICGWPFGLLCGLAGPALSSLLTGMPGAGYLPQMMLELAVYGLAAGIFMQLIRTGSLLADLYISLAAAMLAGRFAAGAARFLIFARGSYSLAAWTASYFVTCLPGIIIQLIFIPAIVFALEKSELIPKRYPSAQ